MKILFMGTPDFAVPSLNTLADEFEVVAVITQPDKPCGRHMTLTPPPVKTAALERGIAVYQPETLKNGAIAGLLDETEPDVIVVVAYGKLLPEYVLEYPKYHCVNAHGSLLPKYRGAAPMQRAIIDGEKVTGITTMFMAKGLDTGDMLDRAEVEIGENDNFESVHDRLAATAAELLVKTLKSLEDGSACPVAQNDAESTYASKISNGDCLLDFGGSAVMLHDRIRGLSPIPLAYCYHNGKMLKITSSAVLCRDGTNDLPGRVVSLDKGRITVACGNGTLVINGVLPEGKGRMSASDFINGRRIAVGDMLTDRK